MGSRSHTDLVAWQKAIDLAEAIYEVCKSFPKADRYELTSQLQRAAISIPANIAEGQGRGSRKEFGYFLSIATGSLREVETYLVIAERLKYLSIEDAERLQILSTQVSKLITGLAASLKRDNEAEAR